eukprot:scaffold4420_cov187-Amphora_coffeaeformis.AAC.21
MDHRRRGMVPTTGDENNNNTAVVTTDYTTMMEKDGILRGEEDHDHHPAGVIQESHIRSIAKGLSWRVLSFGMVNWLERGEKAATLGGVPPGSLRCLSRPSREARFGHNGWVGLFASCHIDTHDATLTASVFLKIVAKLSSSLKLELRRFCSAQLLAPTCIFVRPDRILPPGHSSQRFPSCRPVAPPSGDNTRSPNRPLHQTQSLPWLPYGRHANPGIDFRRASSSSRYSAVD